MIDTKLQRELIRRASPLPWTLATSNSWRRIVDARHDIVCEPTKQPDNHPDLLFTGGAQGPNAQLLIGAVNAQPELLGEIEDLRAREAAKDVIVRSVAAALDRHGVTEADDPGEAIDVLVADKDAEIQRLRAALIKITDVAERVDSWASFPEEPIECARAALQGESKC